jgi:hypothetical protein
VFSGHDTQYIEKKTSKFACLPETHMYKQKHNLTRQPHSSKFAVCQKQICTNSSLTSLLKFKSARNKNKELELPSCRSAQWLLHLAIASDPLLAAPTGGQANTLNKVSARCSFHTLFFVSTPLVKISSIHPSYMSCFVHSWHLNHIAANLGLQFPLL